MVELEKRGLSTLINQKVTDAAVARSHFLPSVENRKIRSAFATTVDAKLSEESTKFGVGSGCVTPPLECHFS